MIKTLYVRIIIMTMGIMIASSVLAFIVTNVYYQHYLKPENDAKVTSIAENIVEVFAGGNYQKISLYLESMADLGYKFYLVNQAEEGVMYGESFRKYNVDASDVTRVLNGETYHGIADFPWSPFITGFFVDDLKNTVGVPVAVNGEVHALFVRADTMQQFGEMRIFIGVLLVFALLFSFLLVLISTRFIVHPIQKLTEATKKIAAGNYHIRLKVNRRDEIGRLAQDFSTMSKSLEQTEEKRQEFVSSVSHEIQSPLTSIQGFSQTLQEENLSEGERNHYLSIIEKESRRLSVLSRQLLTLSFLDNEMEQKERIPFHLADQLKEVVYMLQWQWQEKDIAIEMDIQSVEMNGEPGLIQQVWTNLITNAIRYTDAGGTITIRARQEKSGVHVTIADTGVGIAAEHIPNLFERFYKVDKARTRTENSTGLGLAIAKRIVELHGGTIMVESEVGDGTRFDVYFETEA